MRKEGHCSNKAVDIATSHACRKRARLAPTWALERKQLRSAEAMAEACILNSEHAAGDFIGLGKEESGPRAAIARAASQPDALQILQTRAEELKQSSRKDKKSLASGLRAWHAFEVSVLGYSLCLQYPRNMWSCFWHCSKMLALRPTTWVALLGPSSTGGWDCSGMMTKSSWPCKV